MDIQPDITAALRTRYVCGFAFYDVDKKFPMVVLIRKNKPAFQVGKLNGVGGKIEPGETPEQAMAREFKEEAGVTIPPESWDVFARMTFPDAEVVFLRAFEQVADFAFTCETERIEHHMVRGIGEISDDRIMPNLRWLIPLAFHRGVSLLTIEHK